MTSPTEPATPSEPTDPSSVPANPVTLPPRRTLWQDMRVSEDWWAVWCGGLLLAAFFLAVWLARPADWHAQHTPKSQETTEAAQSEAPELTSPVAPYLSMPGKWTDNPLHSLVSPGTDEKPGKNRLPGILGSFILIAGLFGLAMQIRGGWGAEFLMAFPIVFLLAAFSYVLSGQAVISAYNLEYALWALLVGLIICNTIGTPRWLVPAVQTEFYIKTGLVLLGAEVLMSRLLALGLPGIFVSWVVTPIVLTATYIFGQKILKISSRSLNMVISADMSVCGVSAAIATAAACKAKKEELTLAVGLSLTFTVIMMVLMPMFIQAVGMDEVLAGAWLGGTIDSTGAVAAAGAVLGDRALETAATVKMIQNILIGAVAFVVAIYWVTHVERDPNAPQPSLMEIWYRFPKFVLGFVLASIVFSILYESLVGGPALVDAMIDGSTKHIRGWLFCLAFVSIGLDTNFRQLMPYLRGGKPLILYVCGQALNLLLTFLMAWLMFRVVFAEMVDSLAR